MKQKNSKRKTTDIKSTKKPKKNIASPSLLVQTLPSAQQNPLLIRDTQGRLVAGLFLEAASSDTLKITLRGWHFGPGQLSLKSGSQSILAITNNIMRPDVATALKTDLKLLGFTITTKVFTEAGSLFWEVPYQGTTKRYQVPVELTVSAPAQPATVIQPSEPASDAERPKSVPSPPQHRVVFDRFVGCKAYGWSVRGGKRAGFMLNYGERSLGQIEPNKPRQDVKDHLGIEELEVGFDCLLGGLIHFARLSSCQSMQFSSISEKRYLGEASLLPYLSEGLKFSPMRGFSRIKGSPSIGELRNLRFSSRLEASLLFEAGEDGNNYGLDLYQEDSPGRLRRLGRFSFTAKGQIYNFDFRLLSRQTPVLLVLLNGVQVILMTDCIPLSELFSDENLPLIEYHSLLANGQPAFDVRAKIARSYMDWQITNENTTTSPNRLVPTKEKTAVICYSFEHYDPVLATDLGRLLFFGQSCHFLSPNGEAVAADGSCSSFAEFVEETDVSHFLFVELNSTPRPDFWSAVTATSYAISTISGLIHGYSLHIDGSSRPLLVKPGLLLSPRFRRHALAHPGVALATRASVVKAMKARADDFRSNRFRIEHAFCDMDISEVAMLPIVLDVQRISLAPSEISRFWSLHIPLTARPDSTNVYEAKGGVSVVINYRDCPSQTIQCLKALSIQRFEEKLQIILVNNDSLEASVIAVRQQALELFPADSVLCLDYPKSFNHSAQCNLAVRYATEPFILMLSNDSYLSTPDAILQLREVTDIPWVGTCGFRVVGQKAGKPSLGSLGLGTNTGKYLFAGGSPLRTQHPPPYLCDRALEVNGNTFAAVMIRKNLYESIGGLNADAFPTNYNDVDFCLRATNLDLRHIALGSAVVEHSGRGSREMDLDLPIDNRALHRIGDLAKLGRIGIHWI